jgi:hypothetical protein
MNRYGAATGGAVRINEVKVELDMNHRVACCVPTAAAAAAHAFASGLQTKNKM